MTPFLMLVLAGYAVFVAVLGGVWIQGLMPDKRAGKSTH